MNNLIVNDGIMQGTASQLLEHNKKEIVTQISQMTFETIEDVCENMKLCIDIFEIIKEKQSNENITLKYNPMGNWFLYEENTRICSECGESMVNGYVIENGIEYYCSEECLHKNMTEKEYLELYDGGNGDSYWTEWEK